MAQDYLPREEAKLVSWTGDFLTNIQATPTKYGLSLEQATDYGITRTAFVDAYNKAQNPVTRTPPNIAAKDSAKTSLITATRSLVDICQAWPQMTNELRRELKISERGNGPTPSQIPGMPFVKTDSVNGREVAVSLLQSATVKGKPAGVDGANVFVYYGEQPPADAAGWKFETGTGRTRVTLNLSDVEAACTVWITAFWYNGRKESGPAANPVSVRLAAMTPLPQVMKLRKAA